MDALVKEGKVRCKGFSAYFADHFKRFLPIIQPHVLQSWAHALDDQMVREGGRVDKVMQRHGLAMVAFSPLALGRLLDKYDPNNPPTFEFGDNRKANKAFGTEELAKLRPKLAKLKARFGSRTEDLAAMARDASPMHFVSSRSMPLRIVHGDRDDVVPEAEAETLHRTLKNLGATVELEIIPGCGHGISSVETDTRTIEFLDKMLCVPKKD
jgi:pimeloyl-ACP methyl ester carboxylesterase